MSGPAAPDQGGNSAEGDAGLTSELAAVVSGARRRAVRDGDRQIDTAHLLHALLEFDPAVCAAVGDARRIARLLGYLVQRSIGYGLRWQNAVEGAVAARPAGRNSVPDAWSPLATAALRRARQRALRRGEFRAGGIDLLAAIVEDPEARAVEVLGRAGVDVPGLLARMEADSGEYAAEGGAAC
jgi:ATP-dependent Clp protease ATP-binding subunit ClpA